LISNTAEYALRAMVYLGSPDAGCIASEQIATGTRVPAGYLSKIMRDLVLASLVQSRRGRRGGFSLARAPEAISVLEIIDAVDPIRIVRTAPADETLQSRLEPLHARASTAVDDIRQVMSTMRLSDILPKRGHDGEKAA
jgi:Rrf2 family nitric oxide-sensitive transcriptional repressor